MGPVLVGTDQTLHNIRINITTFIGLQNGRETNIQLSRLALRAVGNNGFPVIIVELFARGVTSNSITPWVVVELDEKLIKGSLRDQVLQVKVRRVSRALRSSSKNQ